jgi:chromosome segregation ATPase
VPILTETEHRLQTVLRGLDEVDREARQLTDTLQRIRGVASITTDRRERDRLAVQYRDVELRRHQLLPRKAYLVGQRVQLEQEVGRIRDIHRSAADERSRLELRLQLVDQERNDLLRRLRQLRVSET